MSNLIKKLIKLFDTENSSDSFSEQEVYDNRVFACLSYIVICQFFSILSLPMSYRSPYVKFHHNQGFLLCLVDLPVCIIVSIVISIFDTAPVFGTIIAVPLGIFSVALMIYHIIRIIEAYNGIAREVPIIGHIRIFKLRIVYTPIENDGGIFAAHHVGQGLVSSET